MESAQEGASRLDGTSRHSTQGILSETAEPGLCHVLPWIGQNFDNSYLSLISRQRVVWRDPAQEGANNMPAHWNTK